jgi:uncharacterized protein (TIGR02246 family)
MALQRSRRFIPVVIGALATLAGCAKQDAPPPVDHRAADEAAIRAIDSAWVKAAATGNLDQFAAVYATDGVLMLPASPIAQGRDAIRKSVGAMAAAPGFALTFGPDKVTVSGDMAYETGNYTVTENDKKGKPHASTGKYAVVWARQADSTWKAEIDAVTTSTQ